ncbi:uncharacterized protein LOC106528899 [Austrofundulus limnaeus]|uniref:Uncharacterized protein LOC106528899 n=1 Tax=Austrofundulus limnaeus TaxID=52670 RepID=A0A2I4CI26_AUSLI|nr:PREDICTED: uncharacterized protein LOC106528899 [Austrofundulus limnaeus]
MNKRIVSHVCCLLLAVLQTLTPTSAQNSTVSPVNNTKAVMPKPGAASYWTLPNDVTVSVGEPVAFQCGVPEGSQNLTFTYYSSHRNYILTCPDGKVEDIPQALYGSCEVKKGELLAIWTLKGTSLSDNEAKVVCQQPDDPNVNSAVLHVYDNGASNVVLIGSLIGGFFGVLLVFSLLLLLLQRSERVQNCFGVDDTGDDLDIIFEEEKNYTKF